MRKKAGIEMNNIDSSTIATIYSVALVIFFVLLVIVTITLVVGKKKSEGDETDELELDESETDMSEEDAEYAESSEYDDSYDEENTADDTYEQDSVFTEADSEYQDSAFTDSAFTDSAFTDSAFADSAFADDNFPGSAFDPNDIVNREQEEMPVQEETEATTEPETSGYDETIEDTEETADTEDTEDTEGNGDFEELEKTEDTEVAQETEDTDSEPIVDTITDEELSESVRAALDTAKKISKPARKKSTVSSTDTFYWYNIKDVAEKPSYKTEEMYYHYFNIADDCIDDLLMEMYDCALVRTEDIRYIAYGIEPRSVSLKDMMTGAEGAPVSRRKLKEPDAEDIKKIYEKWCEYVEELFDIVEIHADEYTINDIRNKLCEFGQNDIDVILEGR